MKRKTTVRRAGNLRQASVCTISDYLRKNVPEYSRRLLVLLAGRRLVPLTLTPQHASRCDVRGHTASFTAAGVCALDGHVLTADESNNQVFLKM